ncbi:MAG: PorT family protein [Prevotella sp.]|jgi:hypothetical protein|nr:PorT family protein [Prevotella sp.]
MKKLFVIASLMMLSMGAFAQHAPGTLSIQPKVGLNIANLTKVDNADPRLGLAIGAELEYQVSDMISLAGGALYSMQGCKSENGFSLWGINANAKTTTKLDYLNIPLVMNVYVTDGLAVKLGVQPGFNISAKSKLEGSVAGYSGESETDVDVKSFDLAIPIGLSYEYNGFVIDGRYNFGLSKVFEDADPSHSVFQITLGYKFSM